MGVYVSPEDMLKFGSKIANEYSLTTAEANALSDRQKRQDAIYQAINAAKVKAEQERVAAKAAADNLGGGSFLDQAKDVGVGALQALDLGRSALVATGHQTGLLARNLFKGENNTVGPEQWLQETQGHIGAGDVIQQAFPDAPYAVKVAGGGALDIAADPLNAVTFGPSKAAKEALNVIGAQAGKDVATTIAREGIDAADKRLAEKFTQDAASKALERGSVAADEAGKLSPINPTGRFQTPDFYAGQRAAISGEGAPTVRSILSDKATTLSKRITPEEIVNRQVEALTKGAKGGVGFAGWTSGIGQPQAEGVMDALRQSDVGKQLRSLFVPTAKVTDAIDEHAAKAVDIAISSGANARRDAIREARSAIANEVADAPPDVLAYARDKAREAMAADLRDFAPRLVSDTAQPGWMEIAPGAFAPESVAKTLAAVSDRPSGPLLQAVDSGLAWLKRYTTLGPLNAVPHVGRNIFSNHLFAALYGGVDKASYWVEARTLRRGVEKLVEDKIPVTAENLVKHAGLDEKAAARAMAIHQQGLVGRGGFVFDDIGGEQIAQKELLGTRTAAKVNTWHEELSRGAVFLKALDDGLDPRMAAKRVRDAMLDYSNEGLTPFERKVMQRLVFFYKFPRRAVPAGLKFMVHYPGAAKAVSQAGLGVSFNKRNQYGQPIGLYADTPLEAVAQEAGDLATSTPLDYAIGKTNPVVQGILDKNKRDLGHMLPIFGQGERMNDAGASDVLTNQLVGGTGFRIGQDYQAQQNAADFAKSLQARQAKGQDLTPEQQIRLLALDAKLPEAYTMSPEALATQLIQIGASREKIGAILAGKN